MQKKKKESCIQSNIPICSEIVKYIILFLPRDLIEKIHI